jgi:succinate dehydrogenase / fumarate reductase flavoprotein subunit
MLIEHRYDVVIVGAGGAGMRAAVEAGPRARTAVLTKLYPTRSHTGAAQGGMCAALANVEDDNWEWHTFDTVKGGDYLADQDAVEIMCKAAPEELLHLEHLGVTFHRNEKGELGTRAFGGASAARTYYVADITGQAIMHVLYEQLMKYSDDVDRYEEWFTTGLAMDEDGNCVGAVTRNVKDGSMELFGAKAVILATGGDGQAWHPTTNALICTGDGISMAYRAGAELMDMEMIQYHPTTLAGKGFLITEGARGEGAHLYNAKGERFMEKYAPNKMELASRDVVSRAEQTEINEGRGFPDGTVALDITVVPKKRIHEALREIVLVGRDFAGVDITKEPIHIKPGNHYTMGGVKTDVKGRTNIPGLYSAGETACVSVHGGNRLGANSLLDTLIFGKHSGRDAAHRAKETKSSRPSPTILSDEEAQIAGIIGREKGSGRRISEIKRELGETMDKNVSVFRDDAGIRQAIEDVKRLKEESETAYIDDRGTIFNQDVLGAIELGYMLDNAECIALGALHRTESRGAQYRTDYPERNDEEWLKHIDLSLNGDGPEVSYSEVTITDWEPQERTY